MKPSVNIPIGTFLLAAALSALCWWAIFEIISQFI
jgi:hypothetical protein